MIKSKEVLVKLAADHYHWLVHSMPLRQDNLFKTYLWLASLALTIAVVFFRYAPPTPFSATACMLYLATLAALAVIVFCLFHMRGKFSFEYPDLKEYSNKATETDEDAYMSFLIEQYWDLSRPGKEQMVQRARALRATTWVLISCFLFLALAGVFTIPAR